MSDVELGNDKRSEKTAGKMETTRAGICISLPLSTQVELQEVGVSFFFFSTQQRDTQRETERERWTGRQEGDTWREGVRLSEAARER